MNDEWIWSGDEENWSGWGAGEFDTREEAIADACIARAEEHTVPTEVKP